MIITKSHSKDGVIEGNHHGHWFRAVVHDENSMFGINNSRISELYLSHSAARRDSLNPDYAIFYFAGGQTITSLPEFAYWVQELILELNNLPFLFSVPETPDIAKMVKSYINHSAFGGLYKDGCCCWGDGIMECQKVINVDVSMCRAGYKHKSRLDGVTIKPYPPERK